MITHHDQLLFDGDGVADATPPTNADECAKGGWESFNNPTFKNQGDCVSSVNASSNSHK